jgi:hypothetical protein
VKQSEGKVQRPGIWDKYRRGIVGPSIKPIRDQTQSIVQRVEAEYPGTARWLKLPLWNLLEADQVPMDDLYWIFNDLDEAVQELLVYEPHRQHDGVFWQKSLRNTEHLVASLFFLNSLDAATALLGLIKEAEICQDQFLHQECYWALITLFETMQCEPPLKKILPELRLHLIKIFTSIQYMQDGTLWYQTFVDPKHTGMYKGLLEQRRDEVQVNIFKDTPANYSIASINKG